MILFQIADYSFLLQQRKDKKKILKRSMWRHLLRREKEMVSLSILIDNEIVNRFLNIHYLKQNMKHLKLQLILIS